MRRKTKHDGSPLWLPFAVAKQLLRPAAGRSAMKEGACQIIFQVLNRHPALNFYFKEPRLQLVLPQTLVPSHHLPDNKLLVASLQSHAAWKNPPKILHVAGMDKDNVMLEDAFATKLANRQSTEPHYRCAGYKRCH